jgi:hypothetical protein
MARPRRLLFALPLALLSLPACQLPVPCSGIGWNFQVGRPATMMSPAAITQTNGPMSVAAVASLPVGPPSPAIRASAVPAITYAEFDQPPVPVRRSLPPPSCDLNEICARLERIERVCAHPTPAPLPAPLPLPKGPPGPP